MSFWLKKAVSYFLMPLQLALVLMVAGFWLGRLRSRARLGRFLLFAGLVLLLLASHKQVGLRLLAPLEAAYPAILDPARSPALARCQYIVVLGGGHADNAALPALQSLSGSALARITEAVRLARALPEARIIVSGPAVGDHPSHAAKLAAAAASLGVNPARFIKIETARDTEEEAAAARALVGSAPVALVTSASHMPRAAALFRAAGIDTLPCPTDFQARGNDEFRADDWTFDLTGLQRTTVAVRERLGLLWLRLRGRI